MSLILEVCDHRRWYSGSELLCAAAVGLTGLAFFVVRKGQIVACTAHLHRSLLDLHVMSPYSENYLGNRPPDMAMAAAEKFAGDPFLILSAEHIDTKLCADPNGRSLLTNPCAVKDEDPPRPPHLPALKPVHIVANPWSDPRTQFDSWKVPPEDYGGAGR